MSQRYQAPEHVSGIICPSGNEYRINKAAMIEVPDDAPDGDHTAIIGAGFVAAADAASSPADASDAAAEKPAKSKP